MRRRLHAVRSTFCYSHPYADSLHAIFQLNGLDELLLAAANRAYSTTIGTRREEKTRIFGADVRVAADIHFYVCKTATGLDIFPRRSLLADTLGDTATSIYMEVTFP